MQVYAINGSPRKKWNTAIILENVLQGAAEARDDVITEMINLYDLNYKGCVECFQCKLLGGPSYGKCAIKDDIYKVLQNVLHADAVVFGSPIYFSDITGMMRCFLERLFFPCFEYTPSHDSIAPKLLHSAFIYTMNVPENMMDELHYPQIIGTMQTFAGMIFGHAPLIQYVNNTLQFKDYSKYKSDMFDPAAKAMHHEKQFPEDCRKARELGAKLVTAGPAMDNPKFKQG